jgi:hypothetical protein
MSTGEDAAAALIQKAWRDRIRQLSPEAAARLQRAVADAIAIRASSPLQLIAHLLRAAAPKEEPSTTEAYCECHQLKDGLEAAVQAAAGMRGGSEAEVVACLASALEVQQVQRFGPPSPAPPPPSDDTPPPHAKPAPMQRAPTFKMKASASSPSIRASKSSVALMSQPPPEQQQTWTAIEFLAEHALLAPCAEAMVALGNDILHGCRDDRQSTAGRLIHRMAATVAERLDEVYRAEGHGRFPEHNVLQQLGEGAFGAGSWLQTAVSPGEPSASLDRLKARAAPQLSACTLAPQARSSRRSTGRRGACTRSSSSSRRAATRCRCSAHSRRSRDAPPRPHLPP